MLFHTTGSKAKGLITKIDTKYKVQQKFRKKDTDTWCKALNSRKICKLRLTLERNSNTWIEKALHCVKDHPAHTAMNSPSRGLDLCFRRRRRHILRLAHWEIGVIQDLLAEMAKEVDMEQDKLLIMEGWQSLGIMNTTKTSPLNSYHHPNMQPPEKQRAAELTRIMKQTKSSMSALKWWKSCRKK